MAIVQKKPKKRKFITLFVIIFIIFAPLVFMFISLKQGTIVTPGSHIGVYHSRNTGYYRLFVENGEQYSFSVSCMDYWGVDPNMKLYSYPFKLVGILEDEIRLTGESVIFTANHDGYYYLTIGNSKGGFFEIWYQENNGPYLSNRVYVNFWRFLLIFCVVGILTISMLLFDRIQISNSKKQSRKKRSITCPICKNKTKKETGFCEVCGEIFVEPKISQEK